MGDLENHFDMDEFTSVTAFVSDMARVTKQNPMLVAFAARWAALSAKEQSDSFPAASAQRDAEVRYAVAYAFVLHVVTKASMLQRAGADDLILEKMIQRFQKRRGELNKKWEKWTSAFGSLKRVSVSAAVVNLLQYKKGGAEADKLWKKDIKLNGGGLLAVNILEAMYQDALKGYANNADAGFELMAESSKLLRPEQSVCGVRSEQYMKLPCKDGVAAANSAKWQLPPGTCQCYQAGVPMFFSPFPEVWNNLYSAWNLAFVSGYNDNILFYAKLLNPVVGGTYHVPRPGDTGAGTYMWPRAVALYMHLQHTILRPRLGSKQTSSG